MNNSQKTTNNLENQLLQQLPEKFTGKLEVVASKTSWTLFFCLGRLAWATGLALALFFHGLRDFRRHLLGLDFLIALG